MINSLPRVKCFLASPIQLGTENDALGTDTLDEVMAFDNCFCSSRLWVFFPFKRLPCLLLQGAWSPCGEVVLKASGLCCVASHHIVYKAGLENMNHLLQ